MEFHEFGKPDGKTILLMHGMLQHWSTEYQLLKPLEEHYHLIIPAMDGMYEGSPDFTSYADQARQIEEYVTEHYDGHLDGVYGASQGGALLTELLARNNIAVDKAVLDGVYVAHQGKWCVYMGKWLMGKVKKNGGKFPKIMDLFMKLMGLKKEDYKMFEMLYWDVSDISLERNLTENYTYHAKPELADSNTKVYLWCGSKEPYAKKSHRILKKYLRNYEEEIWKNMGHGQMLINHQSEMCEKLGKVFG